MASLDSLMIFTFARITRTEEDYAAHKLLENGGNLNAALDAHYRLEDCAKIASGVHSPESEDDSINMDVQEEHLTATSRRLISLADDLNAIASNNLVGRTTGPRDLVEAPVEMRYERRGHTPSVLPSNDLLHNMNDLGEELKALRIKEKNQAAKFFGHEPFERSGHTPRVLPGNTLLQSMNDLGEELKAIRFEEMKQAAKFLGHEPFERSGHTPRVLPNNTLLHGIDDLDEEMKDTTLLLDIDSLTYKIPRVTIVIRMPSGNRLSRRFMKSPNLQALLDFIDVSRLIKPNTYRLVMPFPRQTFGTEQSCLTLEELGLVKKQEALFLEII